MTLRHLIHRLLGRKTLSRSGQAISKGSQAHFADLVHAPNSAAFHWFEAAELWRLEADATTGDRRNCCLDQAERCFRASAASCDRAADMQMWKRGVRGGMA